MAWLRIRRLVQRPSPYIESRHNAVLCILACALVNKLHTVGQQKQSPEYRKEAPGDGCMP